MKIINLLLSTGLIIILLMSCESNNDNNPEFRLTFINSTEISERNISFYDSSTHLLFLKENVNISRSIPGFSVLVNSDTIYKGIIQSCALSSLPKSTFFPAEILLA